MVRAPFRRVRETRRERNGTAPARPSVANRFPAKALANLVEGPVCEPSRCAFFAARRRSHSPVRAAAPAASHVFFEVRHRNRQKRDGPLVGVVASTPRTRSSATSARIAVAEIGAGSVSERVTERRSANRTRTVTVRPGRDFARSRLAIRSARCRAPAGRPVRRGLPAQRRLRSCRMRAPMRLDLPRIAVPGERTQLLSEAHGRAVGPAPSGEVLAN